MDIDVNHVLIDKSGQDLKALILRANTPKRTVLFAAGRGGNPDRHLPLLRHLAEIGNLVVAPQLPMLKTPFPSESELQGRLRCLALAADQFAEPALPIIGVGHSIGATSLLGLAGGELWLSETHRVENEARVHFEHLLLFAPASDFFQAPGAVEAVEVPIRIWVGESDSITTPTSVGKLASVLRKKVSVRLDVLPGAGHFTFMHQLPPNIEDTVSNRRSFLQSFTEEVGRNVARIEFLD